MFMILFRNILCPQQMFPSLRNMEIQHSFCVLRIGLRTQIDLKSKGELGKAQINNHLLSRGVKMMMIIFIKIIITMIIKIIIVIMAIIIKTDC